MRFLPGTSIPTTHILKKAPDGVDILEKEKLFSQEVVNASDLVHGTILGDSDINKRGVLTIEHSLDVAPYVMWKYLIMKEAGLLTFKSRPALVQRARRSTRLCKAFSCNRLAYHMEVSPFYPLEKTTYSLRFNTKTLYLKERKAFYSGKVGEKRVPANLDQILSPQSLAVWFMDDGGRGGNSREGMVLDVTGFCQEERNLIRRVLHDKFLIGSTIQQSSLNSRRKSAKIFIPKKWARPFKEIISPFLIPTMRYKIGD